MKFFCEYCGNRIDADKDDKCPNCGASYKKNKTFLRLEEERKQKELDLEKEKEEARKSNKSSIKMVMIIFIIVGVVILTVALIITSSVGRLSRSFINNSTTNFEDITDDYIDNFNNINSDLNNTKEEKITVSLNEYGKTSEYQVKVTGYETTSFWYKEPKDGYEFVTFHLQVENLTDNQIYHEDVNCIVDGVAQDNDFSSGYSTIPGFIQSNLTVKGDATFEVPKNATSYDIRYGDYVTIHIEK